MLCARFLRHEQGRHGWLYQLFDSAFNGMLRGYDFCLRWVLRHRFTVLLITLGTIALNLYLFATVPKGFFPQQDTGRITGFIQADQDISFTAISAKMREYVKIILQDPAVDTVTAFTGGGGGTNSARMFMQLKPLQERKINADLVIARLRGKLAKIPGATLYLQAVQDVNVGGRFGGAQYQYTLQADRLDDLNYWAPALKERMSRIPQLRDVNTDQQIHGLQASLVVDRDTASRLGVSYQAIDDTLDDAYGQRQVSNIYMGLNQYHVVLEVAPEFRQNPDALNGIYVASKAGSWCRSAPSRISLPQIRRSR